MSLTKSVGDSAMKVLFVGGGAVAGLYGWRMQLAGILTGVVCRSNYPKVRDSGYRIESKRWGNDVFRPDRVFSSIEEAARDGHSYDYVVVSTKALPGLTSPADTIEPLIKTNDTSIVIMQNGIGVEDPFVSRFVNNPIISTVSFVDVKQPEHGFISHGVNSNLIIGLCTGPESKVAADLAASALDKLNTAWGKADVPCIKAEDIQSYRWHKVVWNASFNPMSVISGGCTKNTMVAHPYFRKLILDVMEEVWDAAGKVCGRSFPPSGVFESAKAMFDHTVNAPTDVHPSMLLDYINNRPMEHEVILKNTISKAKACGASVPRLETIYGHILMLEQQKQKNNASVNGK
ncbi:hypothetical protein H4219_002355 [Mycoemilia scoparia]|uniref:2-dehydropantoate 2-reductase n=1 Tax=Mycoemilia scoparia TaxID=417184 RepID=A0A9W8DQN6_9FUNG|nr:hypothetical protein H4219_002355 [Mycoemilia scoparia]